MNLQRQIHEQDPYQRPATVTYGAEQVAPPGRVPQHQQLWGQQQSQHQQLGGYNPAKYPPMPGAFSHHSTQSHGQQAQNLQQNNTPQPVQQTYNPTPASEQYAPLSSAVSHSHLADLYSTQNRWSPAEPVPNSIFAPQQHHFEHQAQPTVMGGSIAPSVANQIPPAPPPKDFNHDVYQDNLQHMAMNQQPQNQQWGLQSQRYSQHDQGYQYQHYPSNHHDHSVAPAPISLPHEHFETTTPPLIQQTGHHKTSTYYQHPTHIPFQQGQQSTCQISGPKYEEPNASPYHEVQHGQYAQTPLQAAPTSYIQRDEPVSPIIGSRQGTMSSGLSKSGDPLSRSNPSPFQVNNTLHDVSDSIVSTPPPMVSGVISPVTATKTPIAAVSMAPKTESGEVVSINATAIGTGAPSDWENFGQAECDIDDLEYYTQEQKHSVKAVANSMEKFHGDVFIELPGGSLEHSQAQAWRQSSAVEIDSKPVAISEPVLSSRVQSNNIGVAPVESVLHEEMVSLRQKLSTTESELAQMKTRAIEHNLLEEKSMEEMQKLKERVAKLEDELGEAQNECLQLRRSTEMLELASTREKENIAKERLGMSGDMAKVKHERVILEAKVAEVSAELSISRLEVESIKSDSVAKLAIAESRLITARTDAERSSAAYQKKIQELEASFKEAQSAAEAARQQIKDNENEAIDVAPGLGDWYKSSLTRFTETLFAEEAADSVPDKMKTFQDWVNFETTLRGIETGCGSKQNEKPEVDIAAPPTRPTLETAQCDVSFISAKDGEYSPGGRPILGRVSKEKNNIDNASLSSTDSIPTVESLEISNASSAVTASFRPYRAGSVGVPITGTTRTKSLSGMPQISTQQAITPADPVKVPAYSKPKFIQPSSSKPKLVEKHADSAPNPTPKSDSKPDMLPKTICSPTLTETQSTNLSQSISVDPSLASVKPKTSVSSLPTETWTAGAIGTFTTSSEKKYGSSSIEFLKNLLPCTVVSPVPLAHPQFVSIYAALSHFSKIDFAYIAASTSQWETKAAEVRKRLDFERSLREAEAEDQSSQLFQNGSIGYGEIGELEDRSKELAILEKENDAEWESYLEVVFGAIYERLEREIIELSHIRDDIHVLCRQAKAERVAVNAVRVEAPDSAVPLADALSLLLLAHKLLTAHETEAAKLVIERDRRFKKKVTRSSYRKGEIKRMKEQELHFERLELQAEVGRRREQQIRCGILMKAVKSAVDRGCDENQSFAKEIILATHKLMLDDTLAHTELKPQIESVYSRANQVLVDLSQSSRALMLHYETVTYLLNDAEYHHQIALERASGAVPSVFKELQSQKRMHDSSLKQDAKNRETGIENELQGWNAEMKKITVALDSQNTVKTDEEADKKRRLQAALENAKRRNGDL